ncbi:MAG: LuxR C-terminal-related transcriptional regulator [Leptolyngbyaceae cyanobacterium bins.59]|nr:LuxR C-terminal-related transcriptional regulator [Leptolyngbyaceae cyanobacterium bins.59]
MQENNSVSSSGATQEHEVPNVLGQFQVEKHQILVISLESDGKNDAFAHSSTYSPDVCTELGRFEVQGQWCAILKITSAVNSEKSRSRKMGLAALLTERELQVATLVASGHSNKQIANHLHISEWTVSTHLRRIFMKLSVDSRAAMVYRCASLIQTCSLS